MPMARAPTTFDAFNAIAEPRRRQILELLAGRRMAVNDIVGRLGWPQPMVSKHLGVLRQGGLVRVTRESRQKVYEMNAEPLKAVHEWTRHFEQFWGSQLQRIKARAEAAARSKSSSSVHNKERNTDD